MSVKDMVYDHERRITVMSKALHCLKLEVRDLEDWITEKKMRLIKWIKWELGMLRIRRGLKTVIAEIVRNR